MKAGFALLVAVVLCGCESTDEKQFSERSTKAFGASDPLNGCYYVSGFTACIQRNPNDPNPLGSGIGSIFQAPAGHCWQVGDVVWDQLAADGTGQYLGRRFSPPDLTTCLMSSGNSLLTCNTSPSQCSNSFTEADFVSATWTKYPPVGGPTDPGCVGTYTTQNFNMAWPSGAITFSPSGCWGVGDPAWADVQYMGGGWYKGTRYGVGLSKLGTPGCGNEVLVGAAQAQFQVGCQSFTEYGPYTAGTWFRVP